MRWMKAKKDTRCSGCINIIQSGQEYYGNSYSAFCGTCGEKKQQNELVYSRNTKTYTDINNITKCNFCNRPSIGHLNGKSVCQEHIGEAVEIE